MKNPVTFFFAVLSLSLLGPLAVAADDHGHSENPLYDNMEKMSDPYRDLLRGIRRPDASEKEAYLVALQTLQVLCVEGKAMIPSKTKDLPETERAAFIADYRKSMANTLITLLKMEKAIIDENWEAANELGRDLRSHKSDGHEKFQPDE